MGIVTVSAPYGAGGAEVAPAVAERLGLPFHDRAIPAQVAARLGVPVAEAEANDETVVRGLWRLVTSLGAMPDPAGGVVGSATAVDEQSYRQQTEKVLQEIAEGEGGVVLGRAGAMVLRNRPDALHAAHAPLLHTWPIAQFCTSARHFAFEQQPWLTHAWFMVAQQA